MILMMIRHRHLCLFVLCCCIPHLLAECERVSHGDECPRSFPCANLGVIYFPFTNTSNWNCGLHIKGCDGKQQKAVLEIEKSTSYIVENIAEDNKISVHDDVLGNFLESKNCSVFNYYLRRPRTSPIMSFEIEMEQSSVYKCKRHVDVSFSGSFSKYTGCGDEYAIYYNFSTDRIKEKSPGFLSSCSRIQLPSLPAHAIPTQNSSDPFLFFTSEFQIKVKLSKNISLYYHEKEGQLKQGSFHCAKGRWWTWKVLLGLAAVNFVLLTILLIYKRRCSFSKRKEQSRNAYADPYSIPNPTACNLFLGLPVFTYKELEEATNIFHHTRELGDGAFGTVYYGKLRDGREVAIKRLSENNYRRVQQFMTEIQILTCLRHRNLVTLYGCSSLHTLRSHELLLVYEYIPNGTVAYHLYGEVAKAYLLPWPTRMKIAIETASALAYLHASDIIHRDVKTSNILLDDNFCVKVADFGLSRLFPNNATHVSTAPQGTPGYVDPEYQQNCQLTGKSDVYSFGVVLIELISSMRAIDVTRDRDEIILANLALKKIQKHEFSELVDPSLNFESDIEVKRMVVSVAELAFRCLQWDKELRPSMDEVLENLKRIANGKDETEQLEEANAHGAVISRCNLIPLPPTSLDWGEIGLLKNMKLLVSPNDIADKWESESTATNASV